MNIMSYIEQGGTIMYILLALNIIGFSVMIFKFFQILFSKSENISRQVVDSLPIELERTTKIQLSKDALLLKMTSLEKGLSTVKIIASNAPLLGLLGTVIGVLFAFESISKQGLGDPSIFAGGISLALITTVGGLIVAIPHYIGYNYLIGMLDNLEASLHKEITQKIIG
jgi:biopolymer transport protein ExbB